VSIQNVYANQAFITAKALKQVKNNLVMVSRSARRWDGDFAGSFRAANGGSDSGKIGDTLNIRLPWFPTLRSGATAAPSAYQDYFIPVQLLQAGVDIEVTIAQQTLNVDEFYGNVVDPMAQTLWQAMDQSCWNTVNPTVFTPALAGAVGNGFNQFNEPFTTAGGNGIGQPISNLQAFVDAYAVMKTQAAVFQDDRISAALNPHVDASIWQGLTSLFHPGAEVSTRWRNGTLGSTGTAGGLDICSTANAPSLTLGTWSGTILYASGATNGGSSMTVSGMTGAFNPGEHFTITGVNAVNPMGHGVMAELKHFQVLSQVGSLITFTPPMISSGPLQNINALPTGIPSINPWGFSAASALTAGTGQVLQESLVFHEEGIAFAMADLIDTSGMGGSMLSSLSKRMKDADTGLRCSTLFWLDGFNHKLLFRLDSLFNAAALRQGFATKVVH
jgi:hypothetical protein